MPESWKYEGEWVCQVPLKSLKALVNLLTPEKVLASASKVEEAAPANEVKYALVSTEREPSLPDVLTKPFEVRLDSF